MQTTCFRGSHVALEDATNPAFLPWDGRSDHRVIDGMSQAALDIYGRGYAMIGYSQFVSPLLTSLTPGYATKHAATLQADFTVMETPGARRPAALRLRQHARVRRLPERA